jgi:NADPH-dependent 2,4-dienoyl-CoA reductase/sulfur reductase-like enzyme
METRREFDVLIAGMGPAGMAAACAASESGLAVGVVDDNPREGGQIWRGAKAPSRSASKWFERFRASRATILGETRVFDAPEPGLLLAEQGDSPVWLRYRKLILATGARERFLPFPGWTLPNVMGAGGLQALAKGGLPVAGRRIVVAGSGPLLLAVAAYLKQHGAIVPAICEQAGWDRLASFGFAIAREPSKALQGLALKWTLRGVPYRTGCWPVEAFGAGRLEEVAFSDGHKTWRERCDYLACGFGLVPNLEAPLLLGCETRDGAVAVNESLETSREGIYCAGEPNGIGGYTAAGLAGKAQALAPARARALWIRPALERAFAPREELRSLAKPETLVCRCEDVPLERLRAHGGWRGAKLQTRCGMGPCQGRVCGPAVEFLLGWKPESVRPPIFPVKLEHLAH